MLLAGIIFIILLITVFVFLTIQKKTCPECKIYALYEESVNDGYPLGWPVRVIKKCKFCDYEEEEIVASGFN